MTPLEDEITRQCSMPVARFRKWGTAGYRQLFVINLHWNEEKAGPCNARYWETSY